METTPKTVYIPTEQDNKRANDVRKVIDSLAENIKTGKIDSATREVIESHFLTLCNCALIGFLKKALILSR